MQVGDSGEIRNSLVFLAFDLTSLVVLYYIICNFPCCSLPNFASVRCKGLYE